MKAPIANDRSSLLFPANPSLASCHAMQASTYHPILRRRNARFNIPRLELPVKVCK